MTSPLAKWFSATPRASFEQPPFWSLNRSIFDGLLGEKERLGVDFAHTVEHAYRRNGVIWTCVLVRLMVFAQARLRWQNLDNERLFDDDALGILRRPWPDGTTGELLARMEQDVSLAGNFYGTTVTDSSGTRLRRLRPDWVTIVSGSETDDPNPQNMLDARVIAYLYTPPGQRGTVLEPGQVAHYSPYPDPLAHWRGMSWLTPVIREVQADSAATLHKLNFFRHGATTNFAITYDKAISPEAFRSFVQHFKDEYGGVENAYQTLHLGAGSDVKTVGADLRQLEFKATQGAGESRVAAAAGVGAVIAQFSEGMQGSSLNAGNYGAARRRFSDVTLQHMWQSASAALEKLVTVPDGARLWFDAKQIPFLQEDLKDAADIEHVKAQTIVALVRDGFEPDSAVAAVEAQDMTLLVHTGKTSVQLQEPGQGDD